MKEIYKELVKNDKKISVRVAPQFYFGKNNDSIYSLSGISNSKLIHCKESGYYSIYQSDKYGFNNPNTEWEKNEIEYFLVGDSFTEGACVNRPNDIASVLRKLSNKSVLNLGQGGNGPLMEYGTLREYLNTNIKKVLWIYYEGNDLSDLNREKKNDILINYLKDLNFTQRLKLKQNQIDDLTINFINKNIIKKKVSHVSKLIKFIEISNIRSLILESPAPPPEFKKILQLSKELTKKNNSKLYFVYLPEYSRYKKNYNYSNYNLVKNIVTELKIPFIDIHKEVFEKEQNPLILFPFELYGHYNVAGYKKVAETIYKFTKN
jgi:ferritin